MKRGLHSTSGMSCLSILEYVNLGHTSTTLVELGLRLCDQASTAKFSTRLWGHVWRGLVCDFPRSEHMWGNDGFDRAWLLPQNRVCMEFGADNDADNAERTQASTVGGNHDY